MKFIKKSKIMNKRNILILILFFIFLLILCYKIRIYYLTIDLLPLHLHVIMPDGSLVHEKVFIKSEVFQKFCVDGSSIIGKDGIEFHCIKIKNNYYE
jgi:hypothetical protein